MDLFMTQPNLGCGEVEHGEVIRGALFIARGDTPEIQVLVTQVSVTLSGKR
jgi:hypothetical protein